MALRCYFIYVLRAVFISLFLIASHAHATKIAVMDTEISSWEGVWFTCEFAQSKRAPDDGCMMFDDEGFIYEKGQLSYLRMEDSDETDCRGQKIGQCFKRDRPAIKVSRKDIGQARIEDSRLIVRYLGCEQGYRIYESSDYMTVKPENKACFWSRERHFYIAPFTGSLTIIK